MQNLPLFSEVESRYILRSLEDFCFVHHSLASFRDLLSDLPAAAPARRSWTFCPVRRLRSEQVFESVKLGRIHEGLVLIMVCLTVFFGSELKLTKPRSCLYTV